MKNYNHINKKISVRINSNVFLFECRQAGWVACPHLCVTCLYLSGHESSVVIPHAVQPPHDGVTLILEAVMADVGQEGVGRCVYSISIVFQLQTRVQKTNSILDVGWVGRYYLVCPVQFLGCKQRTGNWSAQKHTACQLPGTLTYDLNQ